MNEFDVNDSRIAAKRWSWKKRGDRTWSGRTSQPDPAIATQSCGGRESFIPAFQHHETATSSSITTNNQLEKPNNHNVVVANHLHITVPSLTLCIPPHNHVYYVSPTVSGTCLVSHQTLRLLSNTLLSNQHTLPPKISQTGLTPGTKCINHAQVLHRMPGPELA